MKPNVLARLVCAACVALPLSGVQAQTISDADRQKLAENYVQADADGDKALTRSEFHSLLSLNAQDNLGRAGQIVKFGRQDMAFNRIDADGDGMVTQQELQALAR
ncbi:EF-hand domain-containing protein [Rhizobium sp. AAP116]|uniref:EF-hand domain-containing protein n=1 Tax=Rhizobium sp. AAP116 TaxID=1523429 RepID=UPI000B1B7CD3|nr:EF-hand domain-containing protein [Rhizobium sp. AAP116]